MKIKRYKKVQRHIHFYVNNFGFRQPYQLLLDGTFCFAALNNQTNIADNMSRYLQGELKLLTTQCVLIETENLGPKLHGALLILKQYALHKCAHERAPIPGSRCLLSMMGTLNDNHYILATQDRDLQNTTRKIPGVPLLYFHSKAPVLEPPSLVSIQHARRKITGRFDVRPNEKIIIGKLKHKSGLADTEVEPKKRKKKGPNPLSCKKKKPVQVQPIRKKESATDIEKKARKKIRVAKHVKEELVKGVK